MKRIITFILVICTVVCLSLSFTSCDVIGGFLGDNGGNDSGNNGNNNTDTDNMGDDYNPDCPAGDHLDEDNDRYCDLCDEYVIVVIDFYVLNDLHGKFCDTNKQSGVDELGTYFKLMEEKDDNVVLMSSGDMWQGTAESNLTGGKIVTEWMNELGFVSMTLGNHEFDWGENAIRENKEVAEFPFLAINIYNRDTNTLVDYCTPSVMIERDGIKIGIIGAIGDCYSSISSDMTQDITFKVDGALTALVKAESERLRAEGADLIVYSLHDGYDNSKTSATIVGASTLSGYYDSVLSNGYVDLVFEAHSHQRYTLIDSYGVYHLQGGGENSGISHVEIEVNAANRNNKVTEAGFVGSATYSNLEDDPRAEAVEDKYSDVIEYAYSPLGVVSKKYSDSEVEDIVAQMYLEVGLERWGDDYNIFLGGGFLKTRSPYDLTAGTKTYADILSLLPFDNRLVLCSVSGANLKNKFVNTTNSDYHIALSDYGIASTINNDETYYIIVDTYTAYYAPNGLKIIDFYDEDVYARDLFAEAVKNGEFEIKHDGYTLTSIAEANGIGNGLSRGETAPGNYYIKGTVKSLVSSVYGNIYLADENGNEIYVYGLYDIYGNRYNAMANKPNVGDTIVVYCNITHYYNADYGSETIELINAVVIEIN